MKKKIKILIYVLYAALILFALVTYKTMAQNGGWAFLAFIAMFFIFIVATSALTTYLNESVLKPLNSLKTAIKKAEEGDMEYILDVDDRTEIGEVCEEFDRFRTKLKEERIVREQFERENRELITNISHDLKTPITAIKGHVEGILDGVASSPEMVDKYMKTISSKADDMTRLLDELTYYTKIDTNRIPYQFEEIYVKDFFDDCIEDLELELEPQGIELISSCEVASDVRVVADAEQIKRVIGNIISNSVKYMDKDEKKIDIRLLDEGDFVRMEIEDNGKGIASVDLQYIFDRFYRTDSSRNSTTGGSGIGLSIVKKIIEDHGGRIWAKSTEGVGTTIIFILRKCQEGK